MAYTLNWADTTKAPIIIQDGQYDTSTSLLLAGHNDVNYGQTQQNNLILLLSRFANSSPPHNPVQGQMWYNTTTLTMMVYNGTRFVALGAGSIMGGGSSLSPVITAGASSYNAAAFSVATTGGTSPYTYVWSIVGGPITGVALTSNAATASVLYTGSAATQAVALSVVATDANSLTGTTQTSTIMLASTALSGSVTAGTATATTAPFTVSAAGGVAPYTYAWSIVGTDSHVSLSNATGTSTTVTLNSGSTDSGTLQAVITDNAGNTTTATAPYSFTTATAPDVVIHVGATTSTTKQWSATVTLGSGNYTYAWSIFPTVPGVSVSPTNTSTVTTSYSGSSTATYNLFCVVTDTTTGLQSGNIGVTDTFTYTPPPLTVNVSTPGCVHSTSIGSTQGFTASASGGTGPYTYSWSLGPGTSSSDVSISGSGSSATATLLINQVLSYAISVSATDSIGNSGSGISSSGCFEP